ncbi:MAG TPA: VOC family protein [Candidatus Krumholzibacteria bacterium]|nr:VOC family protein [Candidatus Krumholzibacteria bacterium]
MNPSTTFGLSTIGQVAITIKDLPRAIAFYRDTLGVPMLFEAPGMAFFQAGDVRLMMGPSEGTQGANLSSLIYFRVDDIQIACRELEARGVVFTHAPRLIHRGQKADLWLAFFNDPDGNALALMSEVPRRD